MPSTSARSFSGRQLRIATKRRTSVGDNEEATVASASATARRTTRSGSSSSRTAAPRVPKAGGQSTAVLRGHGMAEFHQRADKHKRIIPAGFKEPCESGGDIVAIGPPLAVIDVLHRRRLGKLR